MPRHRYSADNQLSEPAGAHTFDHDRETTTLPIQRHTASTRDRHRQACSRQVASEVLGRQRSTTLSLRQERWIRPPQGYWRGRNPASLGSRRTRKKACNRNGGDGKFHLSLTSHRSAGATEPAAGYGRLQRGCSALPLNLLRVCGARHALTEIRPHRSPVSTRLQLLAIPHPG